MNISITAIIVAIFVIVAGALIIGTNDHENIVGSNVTNITNETTPTPTVTQEKLPTPVTTEGITIIVEPRPRGTWALKRM